MQRMIDDLDALVSETVAMGRLAEDMLERSIRAITDEDTGLAEGIRRDLIRIERYDDDIEDAALRLMELYQPTAGDARTVAAVLKSITHLERISKYAANIAEATDYLADKPEYPVKDLLAPVGEMALGLVRLVLSGFENCSVEGFRSIPERDDALDTAMERDIGRIVSFVEGNSGSADVCIYYISVLKFLERVGDHACKMAEKVCYMVTGRRATIHRWARKPSAPSADERIPVGLDPCRHDGADRHHENREDGEARRRDAVEGRRCGGRRHAGHACPPGGPPLHQDARDGAGERSYRGGHGPPEQRGSRVVGEIPLRSHPHEGSTRHDYRYDGGQCAEREYVQVRGPQGVRAPSGPEPPSVQLVVSGHRAAPKLLFEEYRIIVNTSPTAKSKIPRLM